MTATAQNLEGRPHILVVDDEADNRELLEIILSHVGYFVTCAAGGAEALASIGEQAPDLVLLDLMMPDMNGYEVVARIKADLATKHIVVIMFSALSGHDVTKRVLEAGAQALFSKPMSSTELCAKLGAHLPPSNGLGRPRLAS